jgi:hypothetical protein
MTHVVDPPRPGIEAQNRSRLANNRSLLSLTHLFWLRRTR